MIDGVEGYSVVEGVGVFKARGGCVGVKYGGCKGARDVST